jgi:hypothetical protein
MKPILLGGGVLLLLLGLLLLIAALVMYFLGRNKKAPISAAAGFSPPNPYGGVKPAAPPAPIPPAPVIPSPQPHHAPPPPPPPMPMPVSADTDATVVADRLGFGSLNATSGPLAGQTFPLKMDGFYIGRDRSVSQVVIDHPSVSKKHVWVGIRDGIPTAVDQSSTNGTYLNTLGTRIGQVRLAPGDTLIISDDVARFVYRA